MYARPRTISIALAFLALALLGNGASSSEEAVLAALQARYDGIRDLRARFRQTTSGAALAESSVSRGTVLVQRPGRIRWNYDAPDGRVILLDSEVIRLYSPEDRQLQIAPLGGGGVSPTALSFLMGEGRLADQFRARLVPPSPGEKARGLVLELLPLGDRTFESLLLEVDGKTYDLRESVLVDLLGNKTRLELADAVPNGGLPEDAFRLEVPEGTEVIDLRGSR